MSIAAPMLVISLIIYAGLFGLFIYLVILIIRALKKYIRSKDVRAEKSVLKQNLGEVLKDLRTKNKRRKGPCGRKVGPNDMETNQQVSPRLRLKSMGLRQPRDCLMRSRLYQCR